MAHESACFMSYFKEGVTYLDGGIASGFRKPKEHEYETRLLQVILQHPNLEGLSEPEPEPELRSRASGVLASSKCLLQWTLSMMATRLCSMLVSRSMSGAVSGAIVGNVVVPWISAAKSAGKKGTTALRSQSP